MINRPLEYSLRIFGIWPDSPYKKRESQDIIKNIIVRHQKIIQLSKNIETIFTYISLLYQICCFVLTIVKSLHTEQTIVLIMKCLPYYIAVNCEAFILCYTGEYITSKSENINKAIYNFLWYDLKPRDVRIILKIILRSQKQLMLTAGKFICLSLEAFANMLKASASYVSALYARY
ncbi:odorant receptor 4-like [Apis laboriosa]|uniref:odorant receptor 4-like n=1 Tax=Apis laboriosa TaxID=183418 RepID=UPI001CC75014|nr:odorant receptor 4-like [Apis laboriosa]